LRTKILLHMSYLFSLLLFLAGFSGKDSATVETEIHADLQSISYYRKCDCPEAKPILARVKYKVETDKLENLKMKHLYDGGITSSLPVTEFDRDGGILFVFCISENESKRFTTVFVDENGNKSNPVPVYINPIPEKIINGTAPITLKKN